jgi:probable F420-dependent oxidoreductase
MKFGTLMFATDYSISPGQLAKECEDRGFESVFFTEHTHIPTSRESAYPGGGDLPKQYYDTLDLFVAMTAAAAATSTINVGSGICLVVEHDAINMAKAVASIDQLSGGRVLFGIGAGWNREEMANHGTDPTRRWKLMRERVEAMKAIWTESEPEYHGEFVDFDPIYQWPKPVQKPHPPILLGNAGPGALRRAVAYADEWTPILGRGAGDFGDRVQELQRLAAEAGRDPIPVSAFGTPPNVEAVERMAGLGVDRCIFPVPSAPAEEVLPLLDKQAAVIEAFGGD